MSVKHPVLSILAAVTISCTPLHAADWPVITFPENDQRIGEARDPLCPPENQPCYRIEAEGRVPKGTYPFFAVGPADAAPRMWIQPRIHAVRSDGSLTATIYLGEEDNGARQSFRIVLLACQNEDEFERRRTIIRIPKTCMASEPVRVTRVR